MDKIDNIIFGILLIIVFILGFLGHIGYNDLTNKRYYNGLYIPEREYDEAKDITRKYEKNGDWICINVKGMNFPEAYETCVHECSHSAYSEIFAEECENDFAICNNIIKEKIKDEKTS